ncbi:MAG TPA: DUF4062 domain-containing protein [Blastocatellia bacterium]|nr:DUF4062 domain-containing protein [Blastocatellia bacterium]
MPESITSLKVFVASPGDVASERNLLEEVVEEINLAWGVHLRIRLELVRWETHAYPGVGHDSQDVINKEIGDNYDIFLGILWTRFGTPTKRAESGTAEEFERAYRRFQSNPGQLRIMFYFSQAPTSPGEINLEQLALVNRFRDQLGVQGVLWWPYKKRKEFASLLRIHLSRQIQEWGNSWGPTRKILEKRVDVEESIIQEPYTANEAEQQEKGFFELIEEGHIHIRSFIETATIISDETRTLVIVMKAWNQAALLLKEEIDVLEIAERFKQIGYRAADDLAKFVTNVESQIPLFSESYSAAIETFAQGALRLPEHINQNNQRMREALTLISTSKSKLQEMSKIFDSWSQVISQWPPITPAYEFARMHTISTMQTFVNELNNAIVLTTEAEKLLVDKLS